MAQFDEKLSRRAMLRKAATVVGVAGASALAAGCAPSRTAAPPPPAPPPVIPPAPPMAQPAPPPPVAETKESKREARYQSHPHGRERCGRCVHFMAPNGCEIVDGRISPRGWCRHFQPAA